MIYEYYYVIPEEGTICNVKRWIPSHITGLPGIWCSVFTASPDVSDFFLPKIGQKCQIGDFWGYSGPNLATL